MLKGIIVTIASLFILYLAPSFADDLAQQQHQLKDINQQISQLHDQLDQDKDRYALLQNQLKQTELNIGQTYKTLNEIKGRIKQQTRVVHQLTLQQHQFQATLQQQQKLLSQQVRSRYMLGRQDYLKMVLNHENPATLGRSLVYYRYINQARAKIIKKITQTIQALTLNQKKVKQQTSTLQTLAQKKHETLQQLKQKSLHRHLIIEIIQQQIQSKTETLSQLTEDKDQLTQLIQNLQSEDLANPVTAPPLPFAKLQGQFPWPTKGTIAQHFGTAITETNLTYSGVLIRAPMGQNIYSIYPGKIIFSGWLKGFGLLTIIDHGKGYMTLYAHNQSLYRKVGEVVNAGELIATVGNSGGFRKFGLYFEIRYKGRPLNPESWCTTKTKLDWLA